MTHRFRHANPNTPAARARKAEYDTAEHRAAKAQGKRDVAAGHAHCWRCGRPIPPDARCGPHWQLGHSDRDANGRRRIMGPEHTTCNRRAAAQAGNRAQAQRRTRYPQPRRVRPLAL